MKKISQHPYFSVGFLVVGFFLSFMIITYQQYHVIHYTATEISLEDVPETIRAKMEPQLQQRGAYFYQEENGDCVYALLTAGDLIGYTLNVNPTSVKEGVFFAVDYTSKETYKTTLQYKVFKTSSKQVSGDEYKLKNPYAKPGATGFNIGLLKNMTQGYYITPLMDLDTINRVYTPSEATAKLADGLYRFTYQTSNDGSVLLKAEPVQECPIRCVITAFTDGPNPQVNVTFGEDNIKLSLAIPSTDIYVLDSLRKIDFAKENAIASTGVCFSNQPIANDLTIMSYVAK